LCTETPLYRIFTPAGTLLAYSQPADQKQLRTQASLAATVWSSYADSVSSTSTNDGDHSSSQYTQGELSTLTLEFTHGNLYIIELRPRLLLCLVGTTKPGGLLSPALVAQSNLPSTSSSIREGTAPTSPKEDRPDPSAHASASSVATVKRADTAGGAGHLGDDSAAALASMQIHSLPPLLQVPLSPRPGSSMSSIAGDGEAGALGILKAQAESLARFLQKELEGFEVPEAM
jgi:hypothetical protein